MIATNDTLLLDAPVVRRPVTSVPDRTRDLMRIVRHALKAGRSPSPMDRVLRSAAGATGSERLVGSDADDRARALAGRINDLFVRRACPPAKPHLETVRG